eukprot:TRINITY_DN67579_c0_g1_i1.p1 TRINITY_DN67579_c0_g1~~TRINITY_DN67579_c0_g1_i1.p1  ORF type:complete len:292 (-),score=57.17 TRINITY_DN67579_c0_g1_i1:83-958(-)
MMLTPFCTTQRNCVHIAPRLLRSTRQQPQPLQGNSLVGNGLLAVGGLCGFLCAQPLLDRASKQGMLAFDASKQLGVMEHLGGYFDPLGFMTDSGSGTWRRTEIFQQYRQAELKHGRVAMLAAIGLVTQPYYRFPGFEECMNDWSALNSGAGAGFGILFLLAGWMELVIWKQGDKQDIGDFSAATSTWITPFPVITEQPTDQDKQDLRLKELNNGRLAMSAVITNLIITATTGASTADQVETLIAPFRILAPYLGGLAVLTLANEWKKNEERNWRNPYDAPQASPQTSQDSQ